MWPPNHIGRAATTKPATCRGCMCNVAFCDLKQTLDNPSWPGSKIHKPIRTVSLCLCLSLALSVSVYKCFASALRCTAIDRNRIYLHHIASQSTCMSSYCQVGRGKRNVRAVWPSFLVWSRLNLYTTPHQASPAFFLVFDQIFSSCSILFYRTMPGILIRATIPACYYAPIATICNIAFDRFLMRQSLEEVSAGEIANKQYCAPTISRSTYLYLSFIFLLFPQDFQI